MAPLIKFKSKRCRVLFKLIHRYPRMHIKKQSQVSSPSQLSQLHKKLVWNHKSSHLSQNLRNQKKNQLVSLENSQKKSAIKKRWALASKTNWSVSNSKKRSPTLSTRNQPPSTKVCWPAQWKRISKSKSRKKNRKSRNSCRPP